MYILDNILRLLFAQGSPTSLALEFAACVLQRHSTSIGGGIRMTSMHNDHPQVLVVET